MTHMLKYIFLFFPFCSFGQLSDDSLRQVVKNYYKKDIVEPYIKLTEPDFVENIQERCTGCFNSFKIFIVDFHFNEGYSVADGINSYPKMYLVNSFTGIKEDIQGSKNFNITINSSRIGLSNLEKCYIYLFATLEKINIVTPPTTYDSTIVRNSLFLFLSDTTYFFKFYNAIPWYNIREIENKKYIRKSRKSSIYMYAGEYEQYIEKVYRYRFSFKKEKLKKITRKVVKIKDFLK